MNQHQTDIQRQLREQHAARNVYNQETPIEQFWSVTKFVAMYLVFGSPLFAIAIWLS